MIQNPILPGFHPDPDIIRVGEDYYITTTTFEWYPGIGIHHSRDLVNWELIGYALDERHLDLGASPDSGGNYIPSLTWHNGRFYLVYSICYDAKWPHVANRCYIIHTDDICGSWSDPVYLNSVAFDPALFIDEDGRFYLINLEMETRVGYGPQMRGLLLQEYCPRQERLIGEAKTIWQTDDWELHVEGPHIYRKDGFYYIMSAINGTQWNHGTRFMRSKTIWGPYEEAPNVPMMTSRDVPENPLQKSGQGCLVETAAGDWLLAHHVGRPVLPQRRCPLGRETCLQRVVWPTDGWPELASGGTSPELTLPVPAGIELDSERTNPADPQTVFDDFKSDTLDLEWNTLREPPCEDWIRYGSQNGKLSLRGRQPIGAKHQVSLLARRWTSLHFDASVGLDFSPVYHRQMAGLMCYYDSGDFAYAFLTHDEKHGRVLRFLHYQGHLQWHEHPQSERPIPVCETGRIELRVRVEQADLQFFYREGPQADWCELSPVLDATTLSDEGSDGKKMAFTGAFIGLAAHDALYENQWAHFDRFAITHTNK